MPPTASRQRLRRRLLKALALLVGLPIFYFACALLGSLIPANPGWKPTPDGITIFIRTNGIHTWIVMPKLAGDVDWRPYANPAHLRDPRFGRTSHVAVGFGNRDFYLNTPTWGDLSIPTALAAAFGRGPALMHVEHDHDPRPDADQRPLTISRDQYRRLAAHIRQSFRHDRNGRLLPLIGRGYGPADIFYEARGAYNAGRTCNEWTGEALRTAGIRTGIWTPFSGSLMWRLD